MKIREIINTISDPSINNDLDIDNLIDFLTEAKHLGATHVNVPLHEYSVGIVAYYERDETSEEIERRKFRKPGTVKVKYKQRFSPSDDIK